MKKIILFFLSILIVFSLSAQSILPAWKTPPESEEILVHEGFTVSYNHKTLCPNWSAWTLTEEEANADAVGRTDFFTTDPLVKGPQAENSDYSRNEYNLDRGHMAPSADFKWSREANEQTFYLTNICPQNHALNEGLWLELEQRCRAWAKLYHTDVHIVCGPVFGKNTAQIGKNHVSVPSAFFKSIMFEAKGETYAIHFLMPNEALDAGKEIFEYAVSEKELQKMTGLETFPRKKNKQPGAAYPFNTRWKKPKQK